MSVPLWVLKKHDPDLFTLFQAREGVAGAVVEWGVRAGVRSAPAREKHQKFSMEGCSRCSAGTIAVDRNSNFLDVHVQAAASSSIGALRRVRRVSVCAHVCLTFV